MLSWMIFGQALKFATQTTKDSVQKKQNKFV